MANENNYQSVRSYQSEYKELLQVVFKKQAYFARFFGNELQVMDGITDNETAYTVKTSDIPVVVGAEYNKDANVAFGEGTSNSNRFGKRTEVVYGDTPVKYGWEWTIHEGIDRHTVNADFDGAIADRLDLQAQAKVQLFDNKGAKYISTIADQTLTLADLSNDAILKLFNDLATKYTNLETVGTKVAWVEPNLYNAIVDHPLSTTSKQSSANIDENVIVKFKGFVIVETPSDKFQENEIAYTGIEGAGRQFTGINTARTIESEDFDGVALQGAGKAGEYTLPANRKAVMKVVGKAPAKAALKAGK